MRNILISSILFFAACVPLGANECLDKDGTAITTACAAGADGGTPTTCTGTCTTVKQVTLTVSTNLNGAVLHVWDGSNPGNTNTGVSVQAGQSVVVDACKWHRLNDNTPGLSFWVQGASGYWGCGATGSVGQVIVTGNGRSVAPTPYVDPAACNGSGLVNGFISAAALGINCGG